VPVTLLAAGNLEGDASAAIRARVLGARQRQQARADAAGIVVNSHLPGRDLRRRARVRREGVRLLEAASARLGLSARAYTGILRVARTIADLAGAAEVDSGHVAEAIQYRSLDRPVAR